jgi:hypothetical protein
MACWQNATRLFQVTLSFRLPYAGKIAVSKRFTVVSKVALSESGDWPIPDIGQNLILQ